MVRYSQALAERAQAWQALPLTEKRSAAGLSELAALWSAIQGQPAGTCRQCQYSDYNATVAAYLREFSRLQTLSTMSDTTTASQYQLAPAYAGQTFNHEDYGKTVSADNLTDEDAEFFSSHGYAHAFIKRVGAVVEAVGTSSPDKGDQVDVVPNNALVPQADLEAERAAHEVTKQALTAEKQGYERVLSDFNQANAYRVKADQALTSEKQAHEATKAQLSEVQKQLTTALAPKPKKPVTATAAASDAPVTMTASTTTPAPADATQGSVPATATDTPASDDASTAS